MSVYMCDHCDDLKDGDYNSCSEWKGGLVCEDCTTLLSCIGCEKIMNDESELLEDLCGACHYEDEQKNTAKTLEH
jgi:hypothetical protein